MNIKEIQHVSMIVKNTGYALAFYHDILGLAIDPNRPDLDFPGAWLTVGKQQIHLLELPNPDPQAGRPEHGGRDRHIAFIINDLQDLQDKLEAAGIDYSLSKSGRKALFCRDPDGNALEFIEN